MDRYEHCMIEWIWSPPAGVTSSAFEPGFTVFFAGGQAERHEGGNAELTTLLSRMGQEGWRVTTGLTSSNWILYTLERKLSEPSRSPSR
jgi:hypothetical protein